MVRTIISLSEDDKMWLDRTAQASGVTMTELVRRAVRKLREAESPAEPEPTFDELLESTRGTWTEGDGLAWQLRLRAEWDDHGP